MRRLTTSYTQLKSISSKKAILANPSSLVPQFQSECNCETILMKMTLVCMKMTLVCMKMKLHAELIFT